LHCGHFAFETTATGRSCPQLNRTTAGARADDFGAVGLDVPLPDGRGVEGAGALGGGGTAGFGRGRCGRIMCVRSSSKSV
jgi:hypothetical protein